jgi:hypothetical protein
MHGSRPPTDSIVVEIQIRILIRFHPHSRSIPNQSGSSGLPPSKRRPKKQRQVQNSIQITLITDVINGPGNRIGLRLSAAFRTGFDRTLSFTRRPSSANTRLSQLDDGIVHEAVEKRIDNAQVWMRRRKGGSQKSTYVDLTFFFFCFNSPRLPAGK